MEGSSHATIKIIPIHGIKEGENPIFYINFPCIWGKYILSYPLNTDQGPYVLLTPPMNDTKVSQNLI